MTKKLSDEDTSNLSLIVASSGTGNTVSVTGNFLLDHGDELTRSKIPLYKVQPRGDGKLGVVRINLDYVANLTSEDLQRKQFILHKDWHEHILPGVPSPAIDPFEKKLEDYISLTPQERAKEVTDIRSTIEELRKTNVAPLAKAEAIMSAVEHTFLINKSSLQLDKANITISEHTIAVETQGIVNSALAMIEESKLTMQLFECFKSLSNGQTINHISRVFSMYCSFVYYYNQRQNQRFSQSIRMIFQQEYLELYRVILPKLQPHLYSSDNLVQFPHIEPPELKRYALGAFLHDIGKMANLDYFESNAGYDPAEIRQHVFISSGLILMNYGSDHEDARIMAGDHHNALFHKEGYGVTRWERERSIRKLSETIRCVTSSADEYNSGVALGYLPVELLSIVDIYDAMTDNSRSYKKGMNPTEAILFMTKNPLGSGKIDPVLFDLFIDFLRESGIDLPQNMGFSFKFSRRKQM